MSKVLRLRLWLLIGGTWTYHLPEYPQVEGGLANFAGPLASAMAVLS